MALTSVEDTACSMDIGATGCYVTPRSNYAHVRLCGSHASYSMNAQPVQCPWKLTACRQPVGTCMLSAVVVYGLLHVRIQILTGSVMHTAMYRGVDILLCTDLIQWSLQGFLRI